MTIIVKILFGQVGGGRVKSVFLIYAVSEILFLSLSFPRCSLLVGNLCGSLCHPVDFGAKGGGFLGICKREWVAKCASF